MGITSSIIKPGFFEDPKPIVNDFYVGPVEVAIRNAFESLGFSSLATQYAAWYVTKKSSGGVVFDESSGRKTRVERACVASSFSTNQRFYGGTTSDGKTALSFWCFARPTTLSSEKVVFAQWNETGNQRGYRVSFSGTKLRVQLSADGSAATKDYISVDDFSTNTEYKIGVSFGPTNGLRLFSNGKEISVTKTADSSVVSIHNSTQVIEVGSSGDGGSYFEGAIGLPAFWESELTAQNFVDLQDEKYSEVPTPDFAWFLNGDQAISLVGGTNLTPANSPTVYQDKDAPDWLNTQGWNQSGVNIYPKQWGAELDANGNGPDDANSFGECKRNGQLANGPCIDLNGTNQYGVITNTYDFSGDDWTLIQYFSPDNFSTNNTLIAQADGDGQGRTWLNTKSSTGLFSTALGGTSDTLSGIDAAVVGREYKVTISKTGNVFSFIVDDLTMGTSSNESVTVTMESANGNFFIGATSGAGQVLDGRVYGLKLDHANGFDCPVMEETGNVSKDRDTARGKDITWQNSPTWGDQDSLFVGEEEGCDFVASLDATAELTIPDLTPAFFSNDFDYSFRMRTSDTAGSQNLGRASSGWGYGVSTISSGGRLAFTSGGSYVIDEAGIIGSANVRDGEWHLIRCVRVGDTVTFYVDGVLDRSATMSAPLSSSSTTSGADFGGSSAYVGEVCDVSAVGVGTWSLANTLEGSGDASNAVVSSANVAFSPLPINADSSSPVGRDTPSHPAGPYLKGTQAELIEAPVTDSDSQRPIYYGADFNGTTSLIEFNEETFNWNNPFKVSFDFRGTNVGTQSLFYSQNNGNYATSLSTSNPRIKINGSFFTHSGSAANDSINTIVFEYTGGIDGTITITLNGVTETFTNDAVLVSQNTNFQFGQTNSSTSSFDGLMRDFYVENNGIVLADCPLYKDSLDRSGNTNHGTDTDVSYLSNARATDLNPTIATTETRAVTSGDRKIITIGQQ